MEKLADIGMFESLGAGNGGLSNLGAFNTIENDGFDMTSNPNGTISSGNVQPAAKSAATQDDEFTPEWKNSVNGQLKSLRSDVDTLKTVVTDGFAKTEQTLGQMQQAITRLEQR